MVEKYKYSEDINLERVREFIDSTYGAHYVGRDEIQTFDVWSTMDIASESCLSNIVKYAMRYGKKEGYNRKDLMKIIHYTLLLMHFEDERHNDTSDDTTTGDRGRS